MKNNHDNASNWGAIDEANKYNYLKNVGTEELQALLYQQSLLSDNEYFDVGLVEHINLQLDERNPVFEDFEVEASLKLFKKDIVPHIKIEGAQSTTRNNVSRISRRRRNIKTAAIAAIIAVLLGSTFIASAFGYNIFELAVDWGKEVFQIGTVAEITNGAENEEGFAEGPMAEPTDYSSAQQAKEAYNTDVLIPNWIPDGYELIQASVTETPNHKILILVYQSGNKILSFTADGYDSENPSYFFERNEGSGDTIIINGDEHYFMQNINQNSVIWIANDIVYNVFGDVSKEELVKMLDSIYEGD